MLQRFIPSTIYPRYLKATRICFKLVEIKVILYYCVFSFRGIWPKYYHEVHGFIFVVDATSSDERMVETSNVFRDVLSHQKVRGKPVLMLCNKADVDYHLGI